jgi:protoporphyrin/coproporphyrin ferrochelatase
VSTLPRTGVLLVNLGTPDAPTAEAIRRYLREFLSDRRVVQLSRAIWLPILYGFILPFRPKSLEEKYRLVWTSRGSPLMFHSQDLVRHVAERLASQPVEIRLAMRYGAPAIAPAIAELRRAGIESLVVLPLYPQYSTTTTASVLDAVSAHLESTGWRPALHVIESYHDDPAYIEALAGSVRRHWTAQGRPDYLLMSFHGIPEKYVADGDPYGQQCHETARLLARALALPAGSWSVSFQSRLGRAPWLKPYTDLELPRLAQGGVRTIDVICPGFPADCLETLEEVAVRYAQLFKDSGGAVLRYIPALNESPEHVEALAGLVLSRLRDPSLRSG